MEVIINHKSQTLEDKASLLLLLQTQGLSEKKGIAVAVNNKVIPRSQWQTHILDPNDLVTIIKATQGG
jgi:sulfur carrier protein